MRNECFKKRLAFYLNFEKIAGLGIKIAIFSKIAIFEISKKLIIWHKTIEYYSLLNTKYDMIWKIGSSVFKILEHAH